MEGFRIICKDGWTLPIRVKHEIRSGAPQISIGDDHALEETFYLLGH